MADSIKMPYLSAVDLSRAIAEREISCGEYMRWTLDRIATLNPAYNAIVSMDDQQSLLDLAGEADKALGRGEYRGWLHGIPHAVKDLADLKGFVTSKGSPLFKEQVVSEDDIVIERIRRAGAIFIGKTNVPEFGLGSQTYNRVFGSTKNAFDTSLAAGGSSGGAAVALATGLVPVADGSDMMGSLRNPAAYNNVVGFRPGLGRIPKAKDDLFFDQLATEGPMGRTIVDVIHLFHTMAGSDRGSPLSFQQRLQQVGDYKPADYAETRIGWLGDFEGYLPMEPGVIEQCENALKVIDSAGASVKLLSIEFKLEKLWQCWLNLRHWRVGFGSGQLYDNPHMREELKPEVIWEIEQSRQVTAYDVAEAGVIRSDWYRTLMEAFEDHDVLALPSAQVFPFPVEQHWPAEIAGRAMDTYHRWMEVTIYGSLSGCPVISLPAGLDDRGRSMGIQFIAPMGEDEKLLEFALAYEQANPWHELYSRCHSGGTEI